MAETIHQKPDIIQSFDTYVDREYYKVSSGFFSTSKTLLRSDRLEESTVWEVQCERLPETIFVNGIAYVLTNKNAAMRAPSKFTP